jgi:hypothetical protein
MVIVISADARFDGVAELITCTLFDGVAESVTCTLNLYTPAVVGRPVIMPSGVNFNPGGGKPTSPPEPPSPQL